MERNLMLAALDMDGTLLNSAHTTTPYTRAALRRAAEAGKVVALCTGRCLSELEAHLAVNPGIRYVIAESGACLYDAHERRTLRRISLPDAVAERLLAASEEYDAAKQVFLEGQSCMDVLDAERLARFQVAEFAPAFQAGSIWVEDIDALRRARRAAVGKINLYFTGAEERDRFRPVLDGMDVQVADSIGIGIEISPAGVTKGEGLRTLCRMLGIPVERAMAVGDGGNDLDVMAAAGFAVAMGNAVDAVRALADAVTEDCDHDGAARAVERYLLGEN